MWQRVFVRLLLLAICCVVVSGKETKPAPEDVTYCELTKNPAAYSGKRIRIRAVPEVVVRCN